MVARTAVDGGKVRGGRSEGIGIVNGKTGGGGGGVGFSDVKGV